MDIDNIFKPIWTDNCKDPEDYICVNCFKVIEVKEVKYITDSGYNCHDCFHGKK